MAIRLFVTTLGALFIGGSALAQELTLAMSAQSETLDPQTTSATSSFQVTKSLYDTLVEVDPEGEIVPGLATAWEVAADGKQIAFTLDEATFHDGTPFGSADVKATLERLMAEETASPKAEEFKTIQAVETPDPRKVVLHLSEPTPALLASLASGWGAVLPSEKIAEGYDFGNEPVGTGPFRLDTWVRDSHLQLSRFDDYYQVAPQLGSITVRFVPDSAVQLQGLLSGEFDVIDTVATADLPVLEGSPEVELVQEPSGLVLVAAINNRRPYLSDPRVRHALNFAIDKETVLDVAYGGGQPVGTFMEVGSPWLPDSVQPYGYEPERAKEMLEEAGVPQDWTLDIALPQSYESHIQAGQIVQDMLNDIGIESDLRTVEWGVWLDEVYGSPRNFDLTVIGHTGKLDPTGRLGGYGQPDQNYVGYDNEEVVRLLAEAATTSGPEARRARYAEVLTLMHDEAPFIYFGTPYRTYAQRSDVEGFWITPLLDTFDFRNATVE